MENNFVPYGESVILEELGFDRSCCGYFGKNKRLYECNFRDTVAKDITKAPLWQQTFKWFRTKYDLHLMADDVYYNGKYSYAFQISSKGVMICGTTPSSDYEEAKLDCLNKLIEIAQNK